MNSRTTWILVGTGAAAFVLHAGLLLLAFVLSMSGLAAHGPAASSTGWAQEVGGMLLGVLGFPFLDLALWSTGSAMSGWMWILAGILTSATWGGVASLWVARRLRLRT